MQQQRRQAAGHGVTLIELMVTLTSLTFILGGLGALHLAALRSYATQVPSASCQADADAALRRAAPWIREADEVVVGQPNYLCLQMRTMSDGPGSAVTSYVVCIYPGNVHGYPDVTSGHSVWLATGNDEQATPRAMLARRTTGGAEGLRFGYILSGGAERTSLSEADRDQLVAIRVEVTAQQCAQGRLHTARSQTVVALRNYPAAPDGGDPGGGGDGAGGSGPRVVP